MKQVTIIFFVLAICMQSCRVCTEKYCIEGNIVVAIRFQNFNTTEIDSMLITRYIRNTNFSTKIDSVFLYANQNNSALNNEPKVIYLSQQIDATQCDFEIKLIYNNSTYKVSNFVLGKEECNKCSKGYDYYDALVSYKINGTQKNEGTITITK